MSGVQDPLPAGDWGYVDGYRFIVYLLCQQTKNKESQICYISKLNLEVHIIDICKQIVHFGEEERDASE